MENLDLPEKTQEPSVQSVRRAIQILQCFGTDESLTLTQISKKVGLHKSTTYGIVTTLKNCDFLYKDDETDKYRLGAELCRIAANVRVNLRTICLPHIRELCDITGETVNLVIPDDTSVIYLEKTESQHSVRSCTSIGKRLPMYCTAVGKAILSALPLPEVSAILDQSRLVAKTPKTLISKEAILSQLETVRADGYALDLEELEEGLVCVAASVLDMQGRPVAALSCSGPKQRMSEERVRRIADLLKLHVRQASYIIS